MATNFSQSRKSNKRSRNKKPHRSRNNAFFLPTPEAQAKDDDADDYFLRPTVPKIPITTKFDATNVFNHYGAFEINKPTQSTEVHRSTPFPLKNGLSLSQVSNPFAMLTQAMATDAAASRTAVNDSHDSNDSEPASDEYASSESSRTATFSDDRCRHVGHVSDEYILDYPEQHSDDTMPDIVHPVQPTKTTKNKQNKHRKHLNSNAKNSNDMLAADPFSDNDNVYDAERKRTKKMVLTDNNSTVTHSGHHNTFTYTPHHILSINQRSLSASEYSSTSPHITTHIAAYNTPINTYHTTPLATYHNTSKYSSMNMGLVQSDSNICIAPDEMDEDFYDLLSDAVCSLFAKLDTRNKKAVSYDIIQIGFTLLDINLTEPQFNIFINELSNFRAHKMIKLDMLRSFILNIQNKNYGYKLKQIRLILIDGLLSQPICRTKVLNLSKISRKFSLQSDLSRESSLRSTKLSLSMSRKSKPNHLKTMSTLSTLQSSERPPTILTHKKRANDIVLTVSRNNHKKLNKPHFKKDSNIWRAHITDHDANGACQYDLLLCTLKYSLISTAVDLYNTDSLDINDDKFYIYVKNQAQKQALQYLLESFFHFMGNYAEFMSLKCFEAGLKTCGITFDRKDISIISFGQLSTAFTGSGSKNVKKTKKAKLFITKNSFVAWLIDMIYSQQNRNYKNYTKHYHQYYKWIENDLFSLVNPGRVGHKYKNKKKKQIIHEMDDSHHHSDPSSHSIISVDTKYNHIHHRQVPDVATKRKKHKSQHYHNPVIMPKPKKKQKHRKRRHKSQQIQIQHHHRNFNKYLDMV